MLSSRRTQPQGQDWKHGLFLQEFSLCRLWRRSSPCRFGVARQEGMDAMRERFGQGCESVEFWWSAVALGPPIPLNPGWADSRRAESLGRWAKAGLKELIFGNGDLHMNGTIGLADNSRGTRGGTSIFAMARRCVGWVALVLTLGGDLRAADPDQLPIDAAVTLKRLPNGLTYYIRPNRKPENRAQFHLVVNAGSVLETEKQRGLAHFLEHMAFNGTKNFKKHELINFLERIGMKFGADLNASTSFDETSYRLEIPMDKPEFLTNAMQVLQDWAHQISFESEEIEKERGVVMEEWRTGRGAQGRLRDKQIPVLFYRSQYAERLPIGTTNCIQSVDQKEFLDFYRNWYRPDLMAVVAVGDFDPAKIEALIVQHFSGLTNPPDAPPRPVPSVPNHAETLFSIETDPELTATSIQVLCKHPVSSNGSEADYRRELVNSLYSQVLNQRLGERVQEANPPYLYAGIGKARMVRVKEFAVQVATVKEGLFAEGLKALLVETQRSRRDGFSKAELDRAKADWLRDYERAFEERNKTDSSTYAREYISHFLEGESIPGIAEELRLTRQFLPEITLTEVNHSGDRQIAETNRVIVFSAPEKAGLKTPTRDELLAVIREAEGVQIGAYQDGVSDAPLLGTQPTPGTIVSELKHPEVDTLEWVLSNGIHVLMKSTTNKNDQILMRASSPGGHSLVENRDYLSAAMAATIVGQSGLGAYDLIQLGKKLSGKIAQVSASIDEQYEMLGGMASPKDLQTWFQLIHLHFMGSRADEKTFQSLVTRIRENIENRSRNPQAVFGDAIAKELYGDHPRHRPMTVELLRELDRETALRIYRERFADAGDFTFVFVGSFQPAEIRPLVQKYLASLPSTQRKEEGRHVGDDPKRGPLTVEVKKGIEPKSSVRIQYHGDAKWSRDQQYALSGAVDVLRIRLREVLREDKGGVYGVSVYGNLTRKPKETFYSGVSFACSPQNVADLTQAALDEIKRLQTDGPSADNLEKVRQGDLRNFEMGLKENGFWLGSLSFYRQNELPFAGILELPERAKALTADRIRDAARLYFASDNQLIARLLPEAAKDTERKASD
ncbi:MAG: insulinase family protein [Pedosphaera sp.]|nr:insulinase family protein [Pedosphaera sp.]